MPTTATIDRIYISVVHDGDPDLSWLTQDYSECPSEEAALYRAQDAERLDAYHRGEWHMNGIRLAADVVLARKGRVDERITLSTPGLWGVESDSDAAHLHEIALDESDMLADDLRALGFTDADIIAALGGSPDIEETYSKLETVESY